METRTDLCKVCGGTVAQSVSDGCTAYTCMHPCAVCGHIGDVHRDWYKPGHCRRCHEGPELRHDFVPAVSSLAT